MSAKKSRRGPQSRLAINYEAAHRALTDAFNEAESLLLRSKSPPSLGDLALQKSCEALFQTQTQSYREVLVGAVLCRLMDKRIDIRTPYAKHGETAVSQRQLDEKVVNPLLKRNRIPSTKGPYLAVFRRGVTFHRVPEGGTRGGLRDPAAFDAFDACLAFVENTTDDAELTRFLVFVIYQFILLREAANVPLARLKRISLDQCHLLAAELIKRRSGGRFPLFLVVATFAAIKESLNAPWDLKWQQINVADSASGSAGDIELMKDGAVMLAGEVTERIVDRDRIVSTFTTKIIEAGVTDYLFLVTAEPTDEARQACFSYFAQGHEVNFVDIATWIRMTLATLGQTGREAFERLMAGLIEGADVPKSLKVDWNECIAALAGGAATK